jgi:hypothetical protein
MLLSVYLEYAHLKNREEEGRYQLDCDVLNIPTNERKNAGSIRYSRKEYFCRYYG